MTDGQTRGSRSSTLVSMQERGVARWPSRAAPRRRAAGRWRGPPGRGCPRRRRSARWSSTAAVPSGSRPWSGSRHRSGCTAPSRGRPAVRRTTATPRSSSATAGGGTGIVRGRPRPCPSRPRPGETTTSPTRARGGRSRRWRRPRRRSRRGRRPRGRARRAGRSRGTVASAPASRSKTRSARARTGLVEVGVLQQRLGCRARSGGATESATSTWQRVAAKPSRVTCSTRSVHRLGRDRVDGVLQHVDRDPCADERAEQHVAAGTRRGVDPDRHRGLAAGPRGPARDPGREHARAVAVVDVDHGHPGRAGVEHRQQGGQPAERGAVPDAGRDRDHRHAGQPADDGGQRALHAGHHDQAVRLLELVADRRAAGAARPRRRRGSRGPRRRGRGR